MQNLRDSTTIPRTRVQKAGSVVPFLHGISMRSCSKMSCQISSQTLTIILDRRTARLRRQIRAVATSINGTYGMVLRNDIKISTDFPVALSPSSVCRLCPVGRQSRNSSIPRRLMRRSTHNLPPSPFTIKLLGMIGVWAYISLKIFITISNPLNIMFIAPKSCRPIALPQPSAPGNEIGKALGMSNVQEPWFGKRMTVSKWTIVFLNPVGVSDILYCSNECCPRFIKDMTIQKNFPSNWSISCAS